MLKLKYNSILLGLIFGLTSQIFAAPVFQERWDKLSTNIIRTINKSSVGKVKQSYKGLSRNPSILSEVLDKFTKRVVEEHGIAMDIDIDTINKKSIMIQLGALAHSKHPLLKSAKLRFFVYQGTPNKNGYMVLTSANVPFTSIPDLGNVKYDSGIFDRSPKAMLERCQDMSYGDFKDENDKKLLQWMKNPFFVVLPLKFQAIYKIQEEASQEDLKALADTVRTRKLERKKERSKAMRADGVIEVSKEKISAEISLILDDLLPQLSKVLDDKTMPPRKKHRKAIRLFVTIQGEIEIITGVIKILTNSKYYEEGEKRLDVEKIKELMANEKVVLKHLANLKTRIMDLRITKKDFEEPDSNDEDDTEIYEDSDSESN